MSVIEKPSNQSQTIQEAVSNLKKQNYAFFSLIKNQHTQLFNNIWKNPKFTSKEIIEGFGTDAVALFQLSSNLQALLYTTDNTYIPLQPLKSFVINQDGSITVDMDTPFRG